MSHFNTAGLVIRRSDYGEFDRMVTLLTPEMGRVEALVRGCKRTKSPLKNAAEMFTTGIFQLFRTSRDRFTLEQCTITESYLPLRSDLDRLTHAVYWMRLVYALSQPGIRSDKVFDYAVRSLAFLSYADSSCPFLTMLFESRVLTLGGFQPVTERCVICGDPLMDRAKFAAYQGGAMCTACGGSSPEISIEARRILYRACRSDMDKLLTIENDEAWREAAGYIRSCAVRQLDKGTVCPEI